MYGDFSRLDLRPRNGARPDSNYVGVLHQQGRTLLDSDWNAQTWILNDWQERIGRDAIGAGIAAVPASDPDAFQVTAAQATGVAAELTVKPGGAWADGLSVHLPGHPPPPFNRIATYLQSPAPAVAAGVRDAVILEVWHETVNAFQELSLLQEPSLRPSQSFFEPALGGPDTTERVHTAIRFRLLRLDGGDSCRNIGEKLRDPSPKGKLTVSLQPTATIPDPECPMAEGGGYTGFEHHLYRIEIADVDHGGPMFKWSQFNGGLVGRGEFDADNSRVKITANLQPIITSGLEKFYLEAVSFDEKEGRWKVTYGAEANLTNDNEIALTTEHFGTVPTAGQPVFFRLWNGIARVADFPRQDEPEELRDGIRLEFDPPADAGYVPGDFWTFHVRAGGIGNDETLIDDEPPEGVRYHRVPLAILNWGDPADSPVATIAAGQVEDCRRVFPPLADLPPGGCCVSVRPGEDLQEIVDEVIEAGGGCICLLPGDHTLTRPLDLGGAANLHIEGFGLASRLHVDRARRSTDIAAFRLLDARDVSFQSFAVFDWTGAPVWLCERVKGLTIKGMFAYAGRDGGPVVEERGGADGWLLEDNVFLGAVALEGTTLRRSSISANLWLNWHKAIDLTDLVDVRLERNRWLGLPGAGEIGGHLIAVMSQEDRAESNRALLGYLDELTANARRQPSSAYTGLHVGGAFDVEIAHNEIVGGTGLWAGIVDDCAVRSNDLLTSVYGANFGIVQGLYFARNRIGEERDQPGAGTGVITQVGLRILADAEDCDIVDNAFLNVKKGVVFESDDNPTMEIIYHVRSMLSRPDSEPTAVETSRWVADAGTIVANLREKYPVRVPPLSLGTCERVLIQGNRFHAEGTAVDWSGTKNILDFRITGNSFVGCQDIAISIEPDDRMAFLAEPADTKVRLIDKNRFDVFGVAVRATVGAVRIEKNDIRVSTPKALIAVVRDMLRVALPVLRNSDFARAFEDDNVPLMRTRAPVASVEMESLSVDLEAVRAAVAPVLSRVQPTTRDYRAESMYVAWRLAEAREDRFLRAIVATELPKLIASQEAYVINLADSQNRVVHNRIYSGNPEVSGGVLVHSLSGEVRDNEVRAQRVALMMVGKADSPSSARIAGNSLIVEGGSGEDGKALRTHALRIPTINRGHLAITSNYFEGSVSIGADAYTSLGLHTDSKLAWDRLGISFGNALTLAPRDLRNLIFTGGPAAQPTPGATSMLEILAVRFEVVGRRMDSDPHGDRPVVQFSDNRVVRGWTAIAQTHASAYWSRKRLESLDREAMIVQMSNNILDYWARVVGRDLIITGNHSWSIEYREGGEIKQAANIPEAKPL